MFFHQKWCVAGIGTAPVGRIKHKIRPRCLPKTIIPYLFADTSAVSKPTNVQGDGEISVRKTFRQGRLCKFTHPPTDQAFNHTK